MYLKQDYVSTCYNSDMIPFWTTSNSDCCITITKLNISLQQANTLKDKPSKLKSSEHVRAVELTLKKKSAK